MEKTYKQLENEKDAINISLAIVSTIAIFTFIMMFIEVAIFCDKLMLTYVAMAGMCAILSSYFLFIRMIDNIEEKKQNKQMEKN